MEDEFIPAKILERIKHQPGLSLQELSLILDLDRDRLKPFLEILESRGVISRQGELYVKGPNFDLESRISQVYQLLQRACLDFLRSSIIQRGAILKRELLRLGLQKGFDRDQIEKLLQQELAQGYIRIQRISGLGSGDWFVPVRQLRLSWSRIYYLGWNWFLDRGAKLVQEQLIIGKYPPELRIQYSR